MMIKLNKESQVKKQALIVMSVLGLIGTSNGMERVAAAQKKKIILNFADGKKIEVDEPIWYVLERLIPKESLIAEQGEVLIIKNEGFDVEALITKAVTRVQRVSNHETSATEIVNEEATSATSQAILQEQEMRQYAQERSTDKGFRKFVAKTFQWAKDPMFKKALHDFCDGLSSMSFNEDTLCSWEHQRRVEELGTIADDLMILKSERNAAQGAFLEENKKFFCALGKYKVHSEEILQTGLNLLVQLSCGFMQVVVDAMETKALGNTTQTVEEVVSDFQSLFEVYRNLNLYVNLSDAHFMRIVRDHSEWFSKLKNGLDRNANDEDLPQWRRDAALSAITELISLEESLVRKEFDSRRSLELNMHEYPERMQLGRVVLEIADVRAHLGELEKKAYDTSTPEIEKKLLNKRSWSH